MAPPSNDDPSDDPKPSRRFDRYVGIDYSGAKTPTSSLPGLRVFIAEKTCAPVEVLPPPGRRKYWTRRGIAEWLLDRLAEPVRTLVGLDHAFSFPRQYFEAHGLPKEWPAFLADFCEHWPTDADDVRVDDLRGKVRGRASRRKGDARWRRLAEERCRSPKSVFHFDVQGSVAKSTHSGLPWLTRIRDQLGSRVHFWPFDGWRIPPRRSALAEVYPRLWKDSFPREDRTDDQHDAYAVARWMCQADAEGRLTGLLEPELPEDAAERARYEGWILGVR